MFAAKKSKNLFLFKQRQTMQNFLFEKTFFFLFGFQKKKSQYEK